jgi:hypothetical protein
MGHRGLAGSTQQEIRVREPSPSRSTSPSIRVFERSRKQEAALGSPLAAGKRPSLSRFLGAADPGRLAAEIIQSLDRICDRARLASARRLELTMSNNGDHSYRFAVAAWPSFAV